jgi:putative transposase
VKLEQTRAALDIMGKAFALSVDALRERGFTGAVRQVSEDTFDLLEPVTGVKKACELTGKSRATVCRRRNGTRSGCRERRPAAPNALSAGERGELLALPDSPRFAGKAPRQVRALLIDEGTYLASVSTMYRPLREAGQARERRAQAAHPARTKPELIATGPDQVWSWDITKLAAPQRGVYYHLYVMLDIFSRCAVHSGVHATELGELAKDFMTEAVRLNGGTAPLAIHADRGTSMTSKPVPALPSDLAILKSHSRPEASNDNPYSEAQFKTLKYCPAFPGTFGSRQDARAFCGVFFTYYNHEHRHPGIGLHTPYPVHTGTAAAIQEQRQAVLNAACAANPRRFTRHPRAPKMPVPAWINKPVTNSDITQHPPREAA